MKESDGSGSVQTFQVMSAKEKECMFGTCVLFPSGYLSACLDLCISHYTWNGGFCVQPVLESLTWAFKKGRKDSGKTSADIASPCKTPQTTNQGPRGE